MGAGPERIEVFDPVDRWLHLAALVGVVGALATGPLAESPGLALGLGPWAGAAAAAHGGLAALAGFAGALHLVRVTLVWLDGGSPWGLVPRPRDLADLGRTLLGVLGLARRGPERDRFGYRERMAYAGFALGLPVLLASGWLVSHPAWAVGWIGPRGLVAAARVHAGAGLALCLPLGWHLYFAVLAPEKLWWNGAWITGRVRWATARRSWPAWARRVWGEVAPGDEASPPSVEALLEEGNAAARAGDWAAAARAYREALRLYPGYSQALFNLGVVCSRAGDREGAREALGRFLEQDPFSPVAPRARDLLTRLGAGEGDPGEG